MPFTYASSYLNGTAPNPGIHVQDSDILSQPLLDTDIEIIKAVALKAKPMSHREGQNTWEIDGASVRRKESRKLLAFADRFTDLCQ